MPQSGYRCLSLSSKPLQGSLGCTVHAALKQRQYLNGHSLCNPTSKDVVLKKKKKLSPLTCLVCLC